MLNMCNAGIDSLDILFSILEYRRDKYVDEFEIIDNLMSDHTLHWNNEPDIEYMDMRKSGFDIFLQTLFTSDLDRDIICKAFGSFNFQEFISKYVAATGSIPICAMTYIQIVKN